MHYRLAALCLVVAMSAVKAAPAPDPYAVLDIGPPPKGVRAEEHRKDEISHLTDPAGMPGYVWDDPEVRKLKSVPTEDKYPVHWLAKHMVVKQDSDGNRLRITFREGTRAEQVVIINALVRSYVRLNKERLAGWEEGIRRSQRRDAAAHDEVARMRKVRVVRWAR